MPTNWERHLQRWADASLVDAATVDRIRAFEQQAQRGSGFRWPVWVAIAFGVVLLGAGVLLFVSAHWDELSPAYRMSLVLALVSVFHLCGALTRLPSLSIGMHALGTLALGAGIELTGQIFHLQGHWPTGLLLWAAGAATAWFLLGHWTQAGITTVLVPVWLSGEWMVALDEIGVRNAGPLVVGLFLTALTCFSARQSRDDSAVRRALTWIGGLAILPLGVWLWFEHRFEQPGWPYQLAGWGVALLLPLGMAFVLRGKAVLYNVAAAVWAVAIYFINHRFGPEPVINYPMFALFCAGLIGWGVREGRIERINIGMTGFGLIVLGFYFSTVMDKIGRSASLIGLGVLFLAGGWALERLRRRLVSQVRGEGAA